MADVHGVPSESMMVPVQSMDIQAPMPDLTAEFNSSVAVAGAGVLFPKGPRQAATEHMLMSGSGFASGGGTSGFDITAGFSGGGGGDWPNDVQPGVLETPIQGNMGGYPANTGTD